MSYLFYTAEKERVLKVMEMLGNGMSEMGTDNVDAERFEQTLAGLAEAVKEGAACASKVILLGDGGDLYEIGFGRDLCTGEQLSMPERLVTAIGLGVGSGKFWRGVFKTTGLLPDAKKIINLSSDLIEKAESIGLSRDQLHRIAKKASELEEYACK